MLSNKWNMSVRFGTCSLHEGYRTVSPSWMTMRDIGTRGALGWMSHPNEKSNFETFQCFCDSKILQLDLFFGELMPTSHGSQLGRGMPLSVCTRKDATMPMHATILQGWFHDFIHFFNLASSILLCKKPWMIMTKPINNHQWTWCSESLDWRSHCPRDCSGWMESSPGMESRMGQPQVTTATSDFEKVHSLSSIDLQYRFFKFILSLSTRNGQFSMDSNKLNLSSWKLK